MTGTYGPKYKRLMPCATRTIIGKISVEPHILIMHPVSLIMYPPYCLPRQWQIDLFTAGGRTRLKLQWMYGPLGIAITLLQRGGFPTFATSLNSFIDISFILQKIRLLQWNHMNVCVTKSSWKMFWWHLGWPESKPAVKKFWTVRTRQQLLTKDRCYCSKEFWVFLFRQSF